MANDKKLRNIQEIRVLLMTDLTMRNDSNDDSR